MICKMEIWQIDTFNKIEFNDSVKWKYKKINTFNKNRIKQKNEWGKL